MGKGVGKTVEQVKDEQRMLQEHYRRCFRSASGTIVLDHLKSTGNESPFIQGDSHATSFNVGKQDVIREIVSTVERAEENNLDLGETV